MCHKEQRNIPKIVNSNNCFSTVVSAASGRVLLIRVLYPDEILGVHMIGPRCSAMGSTSEGPPPVASVHF